MRELAAFIMRGRLTAILVVAATAVLPMLVWAGGAALALVTLRRGLAEGLLVAAASLAISASLYGLLTGVPALAVQSALEVWIPVLLLSAWLRYTVSLSSTLRVATVLALLTVVGMHLAYPDQVGYWSQVLEPMVKAVGGGDPDAERNLRQVLEQTLPEMTSIWVLSLLSMVLISLLIGRWLQALLYNPGGFGSEFRQLDLGRPAALAVLGLLLVAGLVQSGVLGDLARVGGSVFALQMLAFMHALVAKRGMSSGWLVGLYVLLPFALPIVAIGGIADATFKWRQRLIEQLGRDDSA